LKSCLKTQSGRGTSSLEESSIPVVASELPEVVPVTNFRSTVDSLGANGAIENKLKAARRRCLWEWDCFCRGVDVVVFLCQVAHQALLAPKRRLPVLGTPGFPGGPFKWIITR
jgi:hypothetical protein